MSEPELSIEFLPLQYSQEGPEVGLKRVRRCPSLVTETKPTIRLGGSAERLSSFQELRVPEAESQILSLDHSLLSVALL